MFSPLAQRFLKDFKSRDLPMNVAKRSSSSLRTELPAWKAAVASHDSATEANEGEPGARRATTLG
jgi:hypothetical protein